MKKLIVISIVAAMLLGVAAMAMATETNWILVVKGSDSAGSYGTQTCQFGTNSTTAKAYSAPNASYMNLGSVLTGYSDPLPLYTTDKRAPITTAAPTMTFDLYFWAGSTFASQNGIKLYWYGTSTYDIMPTIGGVTYDYSMKVVNDPTGAYTGQTFVIDANNNSSSATSPFTPALTWTNAQARQMMVSSDTDWAQIQQKGVHLQLTATPNAPVVPEPSSMLALASGLVGLAGFSIRRRK